ncbi:hypothetical protein D3C80_1687240 [compost metagenome]
MGRSRITAQLLRIAGRQHPYRPPATLGQHGNQVTVASVIAVTGDHGQLAARRPLPDQRPPGGPCGALHQFEARCAGGDQARIESSDLCGAVQRVG